MVLNVLYYDTECAAEFLTCAVFLDFHESQDFSVSPNFSKVLFFFHMFMNLQIFPFLSRFSYFPDFLGTLGFLKCLDFPNSWRQRLTTITIHDHDLDPGHDLDARSRSRTDPRSRSLKILNKYPHSMSHEGFQKIFRT